MLIRASNYYESLHRVDSMAIKEEGKTPDKGQDDSKDSLAALDALEKEASEFNKVSAPTTGATYSADLITIGC